MPTFTTISTSPGGPPQAAATSEGTLWTLVTEAGAGPVQFFRRVLYLRLPVPSAAAGFSFDPLASQFEGLFAPFSYNAFNAPQPLLLGVRDQHDAATVFVTLDAPRQVRRLRFTGAAAAAHAAQLFRLDGDTLAGEPTLRVPLSNNEALLATTVDFTVARFAVRLVNSTDTPINYNKTHFTELHLDSYPTGPRVGLATLAQVSDEGEEPPITFFWQQPGAVGLSVEAGLGAVEAGSDFAEAAQSVFSALLADAPELPLDAALVIESDAPCTLSLSAFQLVFRAELARRFASPGEGGAADGTADGAATKQVLRFPGDQVETRAVTIEVPQPATITAASLRVVESFQPERIRPQSGGAPVMLSSPTQKAGVCLTSARAAVQRFVPSEALVLTGVALGVMPLTIPAALMITVQEFLPSGGAGRTLATGALELTAPGRRWAQVAFREAPIVNAGPYILLVESTQGRTLWLTEPGQEAVTIVETASPAATAGVHTITGRQALYQLLSPSPLAAASSSEMPASPLSLLLGPHLVAPATRDGDQVWYDLATALNAYLASLGPAAGIALVDLAFTAAGPGLLTVYPPAISFDTE